MAAINRLAELKRASAGNAAAVAIDVAPEPAPAKSLFGAGRRASASSAAAPAAGNVDEEMGGMPKKEAFMEGFFKDVEQVKEDIQAIKNAIKEMENIQSESLVAQNAKEAELSQSLQTVIKETNPRAQRAKAVLQSMREETNKMAGGHGPPSEFRIRDNLTNTLTRKFVDTMKDYQNIQTKYKAFIKKKVERQVQIVKPEATSEEIDAVMRSGKGADQFMAQAILKGADSAVRNVFQDVADKYQDVLALETSIAELHQMFLDFSLLVEQQGEMLDQIEYQVAKSDNYVSHANEHVVTALEHAKKSRKWQCCMLLITMTLVVGVVLFLFVFKKGGIKF